MRFLHNTSGHCSEAPPFLLELRKRQDRIELLLIQIVKKDRMPLTFENLTCPVGDGMVKAGLVRMGENYGDIHHVGKSIVTQRQATTGAHGRRERKRPCCVPRTQMMMTSMLCPRLLENDSQRFQADGIEDILDEMGIARLVTHDRIF